jgi:hypothetical protein
MQNGGGQGTNTGTRTDADAGNHSRPSRKSKAQTSLSSKDVAAGLFAASAPAAFAWGTEPHHKKPKGAKKNDGPEDDPVNILKHLPSPLP